MSDSGGHPATYHTGNELWELVYCCWFIMDLSFYFLPRYEGSKILPNKASNGRCPLVDALREVWGGLVSVIGLIIAKC